jgi:hypothetical protein
VGLLKNPIPGKMAIENKRISMAIFAQMVLFQQPHWLSFGGLEVKLLPVPVVFPLSPLSPAGRLNGRNGKNRNI